MTRGRKPKPTRLKIVNGNPGKRPLNTNEPQFERGIPRCPDHLDDEAKKEWRFITKHLDDVGMLTKVDKAALACYCQCWSRWIEAEQAVAKSGTVLRKQTGPLPTDFRAYVNPYLHVARAAMNDMKSILSEFGLTPAARTKLSVSQLPAEDPFEKLLNEDVG